MLSEARNPSIKYSIRNIIFTPYAQMYTEGEKEGNCAAE